MNKDIIGIKLSDGSFYPVLTMGETSEKQLKLTTARDGQTSIRLHLYRSATGTMEDAEYIDSLRIDDLNSHAMNEPTVGLSVNVDEDGNVSAELSDAETGKIASKTVSIPFTAPTSSLFDEEPDISDMPDIPDFDIDFDIPEPKDSSEFDIPPLTEEDLDFDTTPATKTGAILSAIPEGMKAADTNEDFSMQDSPFTDSSLYDGLSSKDKKKKGGISVPAAICIICAVICLFALGIMIFIAPPKWLMNLKSIPSYDYGTTLVPEETAEDVPSPYEDIIVVSEEPIIPEQPVVVEPDDTDDDTKPIKHLIKWGDTLWDIAGCYYKNPWAYPRIVKENNIKNPDYIVSGTIIIIPR